MERTCGICGEVLPTQRGRGRNRKYHVGECANTAKLQATERWRSENPRRIRTCRECGNQWCNLGSRRSGRGPIGPRLYCSPRCRLRHTERRLYLVGHKDCVTCGVRIETAGTRKRCQPCQDAVNKARKKYNIPKSTRLEVYERDKWVCQICHNPVDPTATYPEPLTPTPDHIIPWSMGGTHDTWNLQTAHWDCNLSKGTRAVGSQLFLPL